MLYRENIGNKHTFQKGSNVFVRHEKNYLVTFLSRKHQPYAHGITQGQSQSIRLIKFIESNRRQKPINWFCGDWPIDFGPASQIYQLFDPNKCSKLRITAFNPVEKVVLLCKKKVAILLRKNKSTQNINTLVYPWRNTTSFRGLSAYI